MLRKQEKRIHTSSLLASGRGSAYNQKHDIPHPPPHLLLQSHPFFLASCSSATFVAAVTRPLHAGADGVLRHPLAISRQTQEAHKVYEGSGEVELASKLTGGIVKGECVMVVVKAFSYQEI